VIHASDVLVTVPQADRHTRPENRPNLAWVRADMQLPGNKLRALAFSERGPSGSRFRGFGTSRL